MKELTYVNKKYLGIIESQVAPNPQYLWLKNGDLKRFDNGEWVALNSLEADEYYADMAVGTADNLRGRDEAIERKFTFDVSAGEKNSIKEEGTATITKIKGNTMCWNQLIYNGDFKINGGDNTLPDGWTITGHEDWENYLHISYDEDGINIEVIATLTSEMRFGHVLKGGTAIGENTFLCDYTYGGSTTYLNVCYDNVTRNLSPGSHKTTSFSHNNFNSFEFKIYSSTPVGTRIKIHYARLTNLRLLYPSLSSSEAIAAMNKDFSNDYYDYCEPTFFNNKTEKIVTTGFNQWDEEWVVGEYTIIGGKLVFDSKIYNSISSKNLIEVLPKTTYCLYAPSVRDAYIFLLDSHENYTSHIPISNYGIFKTSVDTKYIMFTTAPTGSIIYNNDICINISHSGVADGTYHPYVEFEHEVPINKYFPNGMRSAVNAYDEINHESAIQRIGSFKVSDCYDSLTQDTRASFLFSFISPITIIERHRGNAIENIVCDKIGTVTGASIQIPEETGIAYYRGRVWIKDVNVKTIDAFKAKYGNGTIYAELAEPIVTPLKARAINFNYPVWDWGTERAVSAEPDAIVNVPFRADIIYGFNAVDTIRGNKKSIEDLDNDLSNLEISYREQANKLFLGLLPAQNIYSRLKSMLPGVKFWSAELEDTKNLNSALVAEYRLFYKGINETYMGVEREYYLYNSSTQELDHKVLRRLWIYPTGTVTKYIDYMMPSDRVMTKDVSNGVAALLPGTTYVNNVDSASTVTLTLQSASTSVWLENTNFKAIISDNVPSTLNIWIIRDGGSGCWNYNVDTYGMQEVTVEVNIPELDMKVLQCDNRPTFVNPTQEEFKKYVKVTGVTAGGNLVKLM